MLSACGLSRTTAPFTRPALRQNLPYISGKFPLTSFPHGGQLTSGLKPRNHLNQTQKILYPEVRAPSRKHDHGILIRQICPAYRDGLDVPTTISVQHTPLPSRGLGVN